MKIGEDGVPIIETRTVVPAGRDPTIKKPIRYKRTKAGTKEERAYLEAQLIDPDRPPLVPDTRKVKHPGVVNKYKEETLQACLAWVAAGGTVGSYAKKVGMDRGNLLHRLMNDHREEYYKAKADSADALAEEIIKIADTPVIMEETIETRDANGELVSVAVKRADSTYARKLMIQARADLIRAWNPERYGSKAQDPSAGRNMAALLAGARQRIRKQREDFKKAEKKRARLVEPAENPDDAADHEA